MDSHRCLALKLESDRTAQDNKLQYSLYIFSFILFIKTSRLLSNKITWALDKSSFFFLKFIQSIQRGFKRLLINFKYIQTDYITYLRPWLSDQQTDLISFWITKVPFGCLNIDRWTIMCLGSMMKNLSEGWTSTSFDARCGYAVRVWKILMNLNQQKCLHNIMWWDLPNCFNKSCNLQTSIVRIIKCNSTISFMGCLATIYPLIKLDLMKHNHLGR